MGLHRWISRVPGSARRPRAVVAVLLALAALLIVGQAALAQTPPALTSGSTVSITPDSGVIFAGQSVELERHGIRRRLQLVIGQCVVQPFRCQHDHDDGQ